VIDAQEPGQLQQLESVVVPGYKASSVIVAGDRAYLTAMAVADESPALIALSLVEPERPSVVTVVNNMTWQPKALQFAQGRLYAAAADGGLGVLAAEDSETLRELAFLDTMGSVEGVVPAGHEVYIVADDGLWIWDDNGELVHALAWKDAGWEAVAVAAADDYLYAVGSGLPGTGRWPGLRILHRDAGARVTTVATLAMANEQRVTGVTVEGTIAYVYSTSSTRDEGKTEKLHVVDISDAAEPHSIGTSSRKPQRTSGSRKRMLTRAGNVYIDAGAEGVWVVDATAGSAPRDCGLIPPGGDPVSGLALEGHHLYIASGRIVDVLNVSDAPLGVTAGSWVSPDRGQIEDLAVATGVLAACGYPPDDSSSPVLNIASLADPTAPSDVGQAGLPLGATPRQIAVADDRAYVAAWGCRLGRVRIGGAGASRLPA
jgi:hypothetical protein